MAQTTVYRLNHGLILPTLPHSKTSKVDRNIKYSSGYRTDFSIQNTWTDTSNNVMLAYIKRINDTKRLKLHAKKPFLKSLDVPDVEVPLVINASSIEKVSTKHESFKSYKQNIRYKRSLGTVRLEPLLGSHSLSRTNSEINRSILVDVHNLTKDRKDEDLQNEKSKHEKHQITVSIVIPTPETADEATSIPADRTEDEHLKENKPELSSIRKHGKGKRMKLTRPLLDDISEGVDLELSAAESEVTNLTSSYEKLLNQVSQMQEAILHEKRQRVALLKQTNYGYITQKQSHKIAMAALAKKKVKRLPPIVQPPSFLRYTNSLHRDENGDFLDE